MKWYKQGIVILGLCGGIAQGAVGDAVNGQAGYVAEGVGGYYYEGEFSFSATASTRFYDSTKGWVSTGNYAGDSAMCWAHTSANMIQYWQSYYGIFYKGDAPLPYGTDYTRTISGAFSSTTVADPMRLNVYQAFYDGWRNSGGTIENGTNWYFTWADAGYFKEYFGGYDYNTNTQPKTATITAVNDTAELAEALLPAMGISKQADGSYVQSEAGLIAHINIAYDTTNQAGIATTANHTLTCYGFTLHEDGSIKSILYADSDDVTFTQSISDNNKAPSLTQVYVQEEDGKLKMYSDAECTRQWKLNTENDYYIGAVTQINTPEVLKHMLAEYNDSANETLYWNGLSDTWKAQNATTTALPDESTGWDVLIDGENVTQEHQGYYHRHATANQDVRFDSHAMQGAEEEQSITIEGTVTPGQISVGEGAHIHLQAGNNAAIAGEGAVTVEKNSSLSSEVMLGSRSISVAEEATFTYALSADTALTNTLSTEKGATVQFRNSAESSITYTVSDILQASGMVDAISGASLIIGGEQDSAGTALHLTQAYSAYALTVQDLIFFGASSLDTAYTTVVTGEFCARQVLLDSATATYGARSATVDGPSIGDALDLREATGLTLESTVNMNQNTLYLSNEATPLTLHPLLTYPVLSEGESFDFTLFENVGRLYLGDNQVYAGDWDAAAFFSSDFITQNTRLVYDGSGVYLQGLSYNIPEPAGSLLGILGVSVLALRRRRRTL
ncbi:MAG: hypothetical protein IJB31_08305 [Akkermansia sp.]|nr:hypothetical protein [Akkermansia sp.]